MTNAYVRLAATDRLFPGEGYWIKSFQKTRTGKLFIDCSDATRPSTTPAQGCASANNCLLFKLNASVAGPFLMGTGYPWRIDWSRVRIRVIDRSGTKFYTPSQAAGLAASGNASTPVLGNTFWVWNGTSYDSFSDAGPTKGSLPYQKSFWIDLRPGALAALSVDLLIPFEPTTLAQ